MKSICVLILYSMISKTLSQTLFTCESVKRFDTLITFTEASYELCDTINVTAREVVIRYPVYDTFLQLFIYLRTAPESKYLCQAGYYVPLCDEDELKGNDDCLYINGKMGRSTHLNRVHFAYRQTDNTWHRYSKLFNEEKAKTRFLATNQTDYWPDQWAEEDTKGVCAYWPKKKMFVYILNGKKASENAILFTRTIADIRANKSWTQTVIPNTASQEFTSAFYWILNGKVMVAIKKSSQAKTEALLYEYIPENPLLFVKSETYPTYEKLFFCKPEEGDSSNEILIFVLMVVTIVVLSITISVICYFIVTHIRKDSNGFGLDFGKRKSR